MGSYLLKRNGKYYVVAQEKARKFLNRIHLKKQFMIWEFLEGRKVHRAMVGLEYVISGKDWMYYIHCLLIEIILYKYGSS